jgi:methyltransferase (TIGR00027 family)
MYKDEKNYQKMRVQKRRQQMKEKDPSFTAMMTAYVRAYHSMRDTQKIFDDFLAYNLIPEEKRAHIEKIMIKAKQIDDLKHNGQQSDQKTTLVSLIRSPNILSRAQYTEDALEKAVSQGVKQYVILGAGLDTFAFRRSDLMEQLEVFEIDHPATQEFKLRRIAELGWKHPAKLNFISIDFTKEDLESVLTRSSSYDTKAKSFFSWLGVTMYLTPDEVFATLRSITNVAPMGSTVVFDYLDNDAFNQDKLSTEMQRRQEFLRKIGEPMITGFNQSKLADNLISLKFHLHEDLNSVDIEERYFQGRTDGYHASKHGHFACATVVE